jgi:hypothetical protein
MKYIGSFDKAYLKEYGTGRYKTYEKGWGEIQIRDHSTPAIGIVMVFPTMGGQFVTTQMYTQARRLARKVVSQLNAVKKVAIKKNNDLRNVQMR